MEAHTHTNSHTNTQGTDGTIRRAYVIFNNMLSGYIETTRLLYKCRKADLRLVTSGLIFWRQTE